MISLAQVKILAACSRKTTGEFGPDKRAANREKPTQHPYSEDQKRRMNTVRHLGRIREDSRAHDAAHYDHDGIEQSKLTARLRRTQFCHSERSRGISYCHLLTMSRS